MTILTKKFSEFAVGGDLNPDDITVGLDGQVNTKFSNPAPLLAPGTTAQRPTPIPIIYDRLRFNIDSNSFEFYSSVTLAWITLGNASGEVTTAIGTALQVLVNGTSGTPQTGEITLSAPQDIDPTSSPTFVNITLTGAEILDVNGNISLNFSSVANAVNYIQITNDAAGGPSIAAPTIKALGSDLSIDVVLQPKGPIGGLALVTECTEPFGIFNIYSGTSGQHQTNFDFANTAAVRGVTFQDASGTVAFLSDIPGGSGVAWSTIVGTTQDAVVNSGYVIGNAAQTTITLPATAAVGAIVAVQGLGAAGWVLEPNSGQTIQVGQTAAGISVTSAANFDAIEVVCIVADTTWAMRSGVSSGFTTA